MAKSLFLLKYGELALKGKNRRIFESTLIKNTKHALRDYKISIIKPFGRYFVEAEVENDAEKDEIFNILQNNVFGIATVAEGESVENDFEIIKDKALDMAKKYIDEHPGQVKNFRIETKRPNKNFIKDSLEMDREIGSHVFLHFGNLDVKLKRPDMTVYIEVLDDYTFIYTEKKRALRGLPVGTAGKVGLLLSGGIDSPVAGYLAQKRGCYLNCIYFHSPPYTTQKAKDKVITLAKKLGNYQNHVRLFVVNFSETQLMFKKLTDIQYFVVLGRRMMMRMCNQIAEKYRFKALVTGENLGQVASQTIENLHCVNSIAELPVLRPLICFDKEETMELAEKIDTFETSILPYDDCCTLFLPPKPNTKSKVKFLEREEAKVNFQEIVNRAVETVEIIDL